MTNQNYSCSFKIQTSNPEDLTIPMKCQQRPLRNLIKEGQRIPEVVNETIAKNK